MLWIPSTDFTWQAPIALVKFVTETDFRDVKNAELGPVRKAAHVQQYQRALISCSR